MAYLFIFKEKKKLKEIHLIKKVCNVYLKQNSGEKRFILHLFVNYVKIKRKKYSNKDKLKDIVSEKSLKFQIKPGLGLSLIVTLK